LARAFAALLLAIAAASCPAGLVEDLRSRGVPAESASMQDSVLVVDMEGSLAEGDSLLKHYGGVFYLVADSVAAGWPVVGLRVRIDGAFLRLSPSSMLDALQRLREGYSDEQVVNGILGHTYVVSL
jgi:hypothetical protein